MYAKKDQSVASFVESCVDIDEKIFRLTPLSDNSLFALNFYIFNLNLLGNRKLIEKDKYLMDGLLRNNIRKLKKKMSSEKRTLIYDKSFLQLLSFTLSSLKILNTIEKDPMPELTENIFKGVSIKSYLNNIGAFDGKPGSGNFAMFFAINLLHNKIYLNRKVENKIDEWVDLHLKAMNINGFFGCKFSNPFLQFQNGYHQYEILDFLNIDGIFWQKAADFVSKLSDKDGHFAPYPGGGGCYDYDAIFFLTSKFVNIQKFRKQLSITYKTILNEQNTDGGWCESKFIRPRSFKNHLKSINHIFKGDFISFLFKLKTNISIQRNKFNKLKTHWSIYSRGWNESDLWDTWFRNLLLEKINLVIYAEESNSFIKKKFINYPGIGYQRI